MKAKLENRPMEIMNLARDVLYVKEGCILESTVGKYHRFLMEAGTHERTTFLNALTNLCFETLSAEAGAVQNKPARLSLAIHAAEKLTDERETCEKKRQCGDATSYQVGTHVMLLLEELRSCATEAELDSLWERIVNSMYEEESGLFLKCYLEEVAEAVAIFLAGALKTLPGVSEVSERAISLCELFERSENTYCLHYITSKEGRLFLLLPEHMTNMLADDEFFREELLRLYSSIPAEEYGRFLDAVPVQEVCMLPKTPQTPDEYFERHVPVQEYPPIEIH